MNTNIDILIDILLNLCDKKEIVQFTNEQPISNEICVTLLFAENKEMSLFFDIDSVNMLVVSDCAYRINNNSKIKRLGDPKKEIDITNKIIEANKNVNLKCGSSLKLEEVKKNLELFKKEKPNTFTKFISDYWRYFTVTAGIVSISGLGTYYFL
jgi:hypothetical protein